MLASEQIAEVMKNYGKREPVSGVIVTSDTSVVSRLENRFTQKEPYFICVSLHQEYTLSIIIFPLAMGICKFDNLFSRLAELSFLLRGILDVRCDGEMIYRRFCYWGDKENESPFESFEQMLHVATCEVRCIERVLLFEKRIETGFSKQDADGFVKKTLGASPIAEWDHLVTKFENSKPV